MDTYFDWGISDDHNLQVGLWSPVLDRFLLVLCDKEFGTTLKYLSSSRYSLYLFDLSTSSNYHSTLIDNSCCHTWTISNKTDIKLSRPHDYELVPAELVVAPIECNWDIENEKQWLQFMWYYLKFIRNLRTSYPWYKYSEFLTSVGLSGSELNNANSFYNNIKSTETYILKSLYLGTNIKDTNLVIEQYLDQCHPLIKSCL